MNTAMLAIYHLLLRPPSSCPIPKGEEDQTCIKFANALRGWTIDGKLKYIWFHPANEISDGKKFHFGNKLRAMGKIPGLSDYVFGNGKGMWCLEVKTKKGVMSENQKAFRAWCVETETPYAVVKSFEEAEAKIREWGILK